MTAPSWPQPYHLPGVGAEPGPPAGSTPPPWGTQGIPAEPVGVEDERPLGALFSDLTSSLQTLVQGEVKLAKAEIGEQVSRAARAGAMLGATGVIGFVALLLIAFAGAWGLAEAIPTGLAFLAMGLVFAAAAALFLVVGKQRLQSVKPVPEQTLRTLRQDVDATKSAFARGARA